METLVIVSLAVWELIEIWHHGKVCATWRGHVQNWESWLGDLLGCPFCLSPWAALILTALLVSGAWWLVVVLAAARLANIGNDLLHAYCRTPRIDLELAAPSPDQDFLPEEEHDTGSQETDL